ncbi:hypothetical protein MMC13_005377 [Lambiella insularis]|nr:hypothetical protein [Lambiella insularis]
MFAHAVPSSSAVSSSPPPASPTGPSRASRLRGLSYLRNYTQQHLSLHSPTSSPPQRNTLLRTTSYPASSQQSPTSPGESGGQVQSQSGDEDSDNIDQVIREPSASTSTTAAAESVDMVRKRSSSSQVGTQAPATRRGQSVPPANLAADARVGSRLTRATSSNEPTTQASAIPVHANGSEGSGLAGLPQDQRPTIIFIPHQDPRASKPSLSFPTTSRTLPHEDCVIRVGRYSERDGQPNPPPNQPSAAPVGFKSKVVSRRHCEFWCSQGQWYIKDVKSSSGTFLNHIRLSQPSVESRPFPVNDGDVVQLGIDFRGGEEMIFRCVKIRIECNRGWQKSLNNFNVTTHKRLRALGKSETKKESDTASLHSSECAICLMSIASLFVAPCSHVWHYKCIRPMLIDPRALSQFMCPNCRAMADLEADVDDPPDVWKDEEDEDADANVESQTSPPYTTTANLDGTELPTLSNNISLSEGHSVDDSSTLNLASRSRQLSITNSTSNDPSIVSPNQPTDFPRPSLLSRRIASRSSVAAIEEAQAAEDAEADGMNVDFPNHNDAAPTRQALGGLRTPTPTGGESLDHVGPLTPRNDAGPFVFDGSAGRAAGRRMVSGSGGGFAQE